MAGGAHAGANESGEEIGRDGKAGAFRDVVDRGDDFDAAAGARDLGEEVGEGFARSFDARRDNPGGDKGGFEEAEVVFGKVEDFGKGADFGAGLEVDAGEA